jgi:hypothetical protein
MCLSLVVSILKPPRGNVVTDETLDNTIRESAAGPRKVSGDAGSVEQHSLPEQIAADKYLESKRASRSRGLGIRWVKITPGGTA